MARRLHHSFFNSSRCSLYTSDQRSHRALSVLCSHATSFSVLHSTSFSVLRSHATSFSVSRSHSTAFSVLCFHSTALSVLCSHAQSFSVLCSHAYNQHRWHQHEEGNIYFSHIFLLRTYLAS